MKRETVYSFDRGDGPVLSVRHLEFAFNLLAGYVLPGEEDRDDPCPGVKAFRRIKGNAFTREHVGTMLAWADELVSRGRARLAVLEAESVEVLRDEMSSKAYVGLIGNVRTAIEVAERDFAAFGEDFEKEAAAMDAESAVAVTP